jgi:hypothetical protein
VLHRSPAQRLVAALVFVGLVVSMLLTALAMDHPQDPLPGVALGSELILAVDRALALFAAWVLVLVVAGRAAAGELPIEISGSGIRYADAESAERVIADISRTLASHEARLEALALAFVEAEDVAKSPRD